MISWQIARPRPCACVLLGLGREEGLEDPRAQRSGDAGTVVGDRTSTPPPAGRTAQPHLALAAHGVDGVVDQVEEHLLHLGQADRMIGTSGRSRGRCGSSRPRPPSRRSSRSRRAPAATSTGSTSGPSRRAEAQQPVRHLLAPLHLGLDLAAGVRAARRRHAAPSGPSASASTPTCAWMMASGLLISWATGGQPADGRHLLGLGHRLVERRALAFRARGSGAGGGGRSA